MAGRVPIVKRHAALIDTAVGHPTTPVGPGPVVSQLDERTLVHGVDVGRERILDDAALHLE